MNPSLRRRLNRAANLGLGLAVFLGTLPFGMRAYGHWSQRAAMADFQRDLAAASPKGTIPPQPRPLNRPRRAWETSVVQIPSIGVDAVVTEGAGKWELVIGPGHLPG